MIKFEHGMLVLDNNTNKDDVDAIEEFAKYVRNQENKRIFELLDELVNSHLMQSWLVEAEVVANAIKSIKDKNGTSN